MKRARATGRLGAVAALAAITLAACGGGDGASEEQAESTTISWVSFQPESHPEVERVTENFWAPIAEQTDVEFEYRGGPDTMAPADMGAAVQSGVVDAAMIYVGAYESNVPAAGAWTLTELSPQEERETGAVEAFDALHQEEGLKYLARVQPQEENFYFTWLRGERLESQADFSGKIIGSAAGAQAAVPAWGAALESVAVPDNYTALERGVVDGVAGQPLEGAVTNGWYELVDYVIDEPYYQSSVVLIMNKDVWDGLAEEAQEAITQTVAAAEADAVGLRASALAEARATIEASGVEFYNLPPDVAEWYLDSAYEAARTDLVERFPDVAPDLLQSLSE